MKNNDCCGTFHSEGAHPNPEICLSPDKSESVVEATPPTSREDPEPFMKQTPVSTNLPGLQLVRTFAPDEEKQLNALRLLADAASAENRSDEPSPY